MINRERPGKHDDMWEKPVFMRVSDGTAPGKYRQLSNILRKKTLVISGVNFYVLVSWIGAGGPWPVSGCHERTIPRKTA